jgi:quinol monooxygenase YgiN
MRSLVVACYAPKPGCAEKLLELVRDHLPPLRAQGLVTPREAIVMRSADGTILEVFEWISQEAIAAAHSNPVVLAMWEKFEAVCTYATPASVPELQTLFGHLEPV